MAEVTGYDRNDFHGSTIKDKDLEQKLTTPKFEPIFKFNMLLVSHYQKLQPSRHNTRNRSILNQSMK